MAGIAIGVLPARLLAAGGNAADLQRACGSPGTRSWLCETVFRITGSNGAADVADAVSRPAGIALVVVLAFVATRVSRRLVRRLADRLKAGTVPGTTTSLRRTQRADTTAAVLGSTVAVVIWTVAVITVLGDLGVELAPLLAGAGVAGVALGFGAQAVVRDFLAGTFMLLEDQFGVGDVIEVGTSGTAVSGSVESLTLRVTRIRDVEGTLWSVPNGEIRRVGNKAQQWARAVLDLALAPDTVVADATTVIARVASELRADPAWHGRIPTEPEVWGVEHLEGDRVVIRLVVRTMPLAQWDVARALRARLKVAFEDAGIDLAVAQLITTGAERAPRRGGDGQEDAG
ncbi:MAG TPA: mechanosensitive ion channel family protein [Acidimicrobiia bacterium]|jgi:small conductance mechanosensitive channel|nr:mechanosensitive ion channel family protein [Acidimicrobiia bacterium]